MADQIDSVTGGGGDFSLNNFTDTAVTFNVPDGAFDVFFSDTYIGTSSSADGLHTRSLSQIQMVFPNSPATINFKFPSTGNQDPPYTATFTVSWSDPFDGYATTEDVNNTLEDYVPIQEVDNYIEEWWNSEVRPELEAINTTLASILQQLTPVTSEAQNETLADQFARLRYLGDHDTFFNYDNPAFTTSGQGIEISFTVTQSDTTYSVVFNNPGSGFLETETITVIGTELGGNSPANDLTITIDSVGDFGEITASSVAGAAVKPQTGITTTSPYGEIYLAAAFKQLISEGGILSKEANAKSDEDVASLLSQLEALPNEQLKAESLNYLQTLITQAKDSLGNL